MKPTIDKVPYPQEDVDNLVDNLCKLHIQLNRSKSTIGESRLKDAMDMLNTRLSQTLLEPEYVIINEREGD